MGVKDSYDGRLDVATSSAIFFLGERTLIFIREKQGEK